MNILISGASIAGPALALALRQTDLPCRITIVERAPSLRRGGYAVDIRGSALEAVERLGLREELRKWETDTLSNSVVDRRGRRFGRTARGFGVIDPGDVEIPRGDLAGVLYERTRPTVDYRFGDEIVALVPTDDGVRVSLASGRVERYDLVVGADGVHSRTRALAFGAEAELVKPMVSHLGGTYLAIFSAPNWLGLDREQLLFQDVGRIASIKPTDGNRRLMVCLFFTGPTSGFDPDDVAAQRRLTASAFADAGWEFPAVMAAMAQADDFYSDVTCQVHVDRLWQGRVALVGDAGYCPSPLSGQGTSLALAGAYLLAQSLARRPIDDALARYDAAMGPFAKANQKIARDLADNFAPRSAWSARGRNLAMRLLPYTPGASLIMKWAMKNVRSASRALKLPEPAPAAIADQVLGNGSRVASMGLDSSGSSSTS